MEQLQQVLQNHGIIAYPTETVYGLGCLPDDEKALNRILQLKQRDAGKGFILIAHKIAFLQVFTPVELKKIQTRLAAPPPTTWLVPCKKQWQGLLTGYRDKIAIRLSPHPQVAQICKVIDSALVSTSLNEQGASPIDNQQEAMAQFADKVDRVIGGDCGRQPPSRIIDLQSGQVFRSA